MSDELKTGKKARKAKKSKNLLPVATDLAAVEVFEKKNELLSAHYPEVSALDFYRFIFSPEEIERKGDTSYRASNPIFAYCLRIGKDKDGNSKVFFRNEIAFQDTFEQSLALTAANPLSLCSMVSYSGRNKTAKNAYRCHGFAIDLDGVGVNQLNSFWYYVDHVGVIPEPTFIVNSGHGLHIYYVFEHPVPLYPNVVEHLQNLKRGLTEWVWNRETSSYPVKERQYQGIYQCFRMVGSCTKLGAGADMGKYLLRAWETGKRVTISYLNNFVLDEKYKCPEGLDYSSWKWASAHHTLSECQRLWPNWYQRRIVEKQPAGQWKCSPKLYEWWLRKIREPGNARDGNRYHCISMLYVYAQKCCIDKAVVDADAEELLGPFNLLTINSDNAFTAADIKAASKFYDPKFVKFTRKEISRRTGIEITTRRKPKTIKLDPKTGKELKLTKAQQLEFQRKVQDMKLRDYGIDWRNKDGAPKKQNVVWKWRAAHPDGRKIDCEKETRLSRHTVLKWWDKPLDIRQTRRPLTKKEKELLMEQLFGDPPAETPAAVDASELEHEPL